MSNDAEMRCIPTIVVEMVLGPPPTPKERTMEIEIKVGPELDRAVAEAMSLDERWGFYACEHCGAAHFDCYTVADWAFCSCPKPQDGPIPRLSLADFRPSTDLNAAFAAARQVGLFGDWLLGRHQGRHGRPCPWYFEDQSKRPMQGVLCATPALAICAAILKLKGLTCPTS
jgi:hypothetical protein